MALQSSRIEVITGLTLGKGQPSMTPLTPDRIAPFRSSRVRLPGTGLRRQLTLAIYRQGMAIAATLMSVIFLIAAHWPEYVQWLAAATLPIFMAAILHENWRMEVLSKGLDAESLVGKRLSGLERHGYRVVHDFEGRGFNIDHILIGPQGVFAIETKYVSKLKGLADKIEYRADKLFLRGKEMRSNAVQQAKRGALDLKSMLSSKGFSVGVRPIVVIPGWYIEGRGENSDSPWVLELKAVSKWLEKEPLRLNDEEIKRIHYVLRESAERELEWDSAT